MRRRHRWLGRNSRVKIADRRRNEDVEPEILYSNGGGKDSSGPLPSTARAMLAFQIVNAGFGFDVILYLNRTRTRDELWLLHTGEDGLHQNYAALESGVALLNSYRKSNFDKPFCHMAINRQASESDSCLFLLTAYCRGIIPYNAPGRFIAPGLLSKGVYNDVIASIKGEIASNRADAEKQESEIIETARRLDLKPEAPFLSPGIWSATCPGTRHHLFLSSKSNTFGCGYCGVKGGPIDLISFVEGRKENSK